MNLYRCEINSGPVKEIKYYKSFIERNKNNIGKRARRCKTSEQQQKINKIRAEKNIQRLILCNFQEGDYFIRLSSPFNKFTENEVEKIFRNFVRRVKYYAKKNNKQFKYIACCECGSRGSNWHIHIIVNSEIKDIVYKCWKWKNGVNFQLLYAQGNYKDLAKYMRKDIRGKKKIKTSRNLNKPTYNISQLNKRDYRRLQCGEIIDFPQGYTLNETPTMYVNDYTGAAFYFTFTKIQQHKKELFAVECKIKKLPYSNAKEQPFNEKVLY